MYEVQIFYPGDLLARVTVKAASAASTLDLIPQLLAEHDGCERAVVIGGGVRLFVVDCAGNTLP